MAELSLEEILKEVCPLCKAAPTAKCLEKKRGGMGGMYWIENPHVERIRIALDKKMKQEKNENRAA